MNETKSKSSAEPFILFELGGTTYAIRSRDVQEMEMVEHITPVPNAPSYVEGVAFLRGQVIPVMDLRCRFGLHKIPYNIKTRLVVVRHKERVVGLVVDTCRQFTQIPAETVQPPPEAISHSTRAYLHGFAMLNEKPVLILDVGALLASTDVKVPDQPTNKA